MNESIAQWMPLLSFLPLLLLLAWIASKEHRPKQWWFDWGRWRFGYTSETIGKRECPYLFRRILWLGGPSLRYHVFYNSDEDRALHDHPWTFWTFPLNDYLETYWNEEDQVRLQRLVHSFRLHKRPHGFKHVVMTLEPTVVKYGQDGVGIVRDKKPTRTFVLTGPKRSSWNFWKDGRKYPWRQWINKMGLPPCQEPARKA